MTRTIVKSIDDMPGEARDGIPLGCVIDKRPNTGHRIVAYGQGGTFSAAGMRMVATELRSYLAYFASREEDDLEVPVIVRAIDINAALLWLREHYHGSFALYVKSASTYLGEFDEGGPECVECRLVAEHDADCARVNDDPS